MTREIPMDELRHHEWGARAADAIPGGSSTGSKRPDALYGSRASDAAAPTHFERASGCTLYAPDGRTFIDCTMALGAVAIGYADAAVTRAVQEAAADGNVTGLPHRLEVEVAEQLIELIPCAEQVRFLRTGAEATAAAIRIARTYTSRQHIIACGYFGWLDWCNDAQGVLAAERDAVTWIPFNDIAALNNAVRNQAAPLAAIIMEPLVHDLATAEWLQAARDACEKLGAVLIFDEIKTAFRVRTGGVQELLDIAPDLTTVGKAMANGYPLAAVVGRADIMTAATSTWISSTAAAESTGLAAARAVMGWHDRVNVPSRLAEIGGVMQEIVASALQRAPWVGVRTDGHPTMWRLVADVPEQLDALVVTAARNGLLLKRGAYQFASLAHNDAILDQIEQLLPSITEALRPGPRRMID